MKEKFEALKENWSQPRKAKYCSDECCPELSCIFYPSIEVEQLTNLSNTLKTLCIPEEYKEFLMLSDGALLFLDEKYGQWGLKLYDIQSIGSEINKWNNTYRQDQFIFGDLIIGEFLGDSDLLIIRCDENSSDFGNVLVSLPIDERENWYNPSSNFSSFLEKYIKLEGEKFWEKRQ
nr:SMI1/KNR4 family protein [Moraxella osloensis]